MDGGDVRGSAGIIRMNSGTALSWFNIGFITKRLPDPEAAVRRAVGYYDAAEVPCILRIRDGVDPDAERACAAIGLPYSDTVPGMVLPALDAIPPSTPDVDIRVARDEETLAHHRQIASVAFDLPRDMAERYVPLRVTERPTSNSTSDTLMADPPRHPRCSRRIGSPASTRWPSCRSSAGEAVGEAMTWHAVRAGRRVGGIMSSLQASKLGKPIYARMGFREMIGYRTFHRPGI